MNVELARFNMIEQQIRTWEVLDDRVLTLFGQVHREAFVPPSERSLAFADVNIPLGYGQCMMAPKVEARMIQALSITETDSVLEIGTGSGYTAALLGMMAHEVVSVDTIAEFTQSATTKLADASIRNVLCETGNAAYGWPTHDRYHVIAATGSYPLFPDELAQRLKIGGRLFVIVGEAPIMEALLVTRVGETAWRRESLFETYIPALQHVQIPQRFIF